MKFEREATTKNGRRTWKVTYELVRGPVPKPKADKPAASDSPAVDYAQPAGKQSDAKKRLGPKRQPKKPERRLPNGKKKNKSNRTQLGLF